MVHIDGTVNGPQLLLELYENLSNEMTCLSEEENTTMLPLLKVFLPHYLFTP